MSDFGQVSPEGTLLERAHRRRQAAIDRRRAWFRQAERFWIEEFDRDVDPASAAIARAMNSARLDVENTAPLDHYICLVAGEVHLPDR